MIECNHCNMCVNKSWISFSNIRGENINLCCYTCNNEYPILYKWKDVKNKDDFQYIPIVTKKQKKDPLENFYILTEEEVENLSEEEFINYLDDLEEFKTFYPEKYEVISQIFYDDLDIEYYDSEDDCDSDGVW